MSTPTKTLPLLALFALSCAAHAPPPEAPPPAPRDPPPATLAPPAFAPAEVAAVPASDPRSQRSETRRAIFTAVWTTVRDKHYDKTLAGVDWDAAREKYEPLALAAPDAPTFYRFLNEMLGTLGQSHLEVTGPGAEANPLLEEAPGESLPAPQSGAAAETQPAAGVVASSDIGDPGLVIRVIDGRPTVTAVRKGSSAA